MSKLALALGSFAVGAVSMFLASSLLPGKMDTAFAQSSMGKDARPIVPALPESVRVNGGVTFGPAPWRLDGINCSGCVFQDSQLEYWGGPFRCLNCLFSGNVTLELKGAAGNGVQVTRWFRELSEHRSPDLSRQESMERFEIKEKITASIATAKGK